MLDNRETHEIIDFIAVSAVEIEWSVWLIVVVLWFYVMANSITDVLPGGRFVKQE